MSPPIFHTAGNWHFPNILHAEGFTMLCKQLNLSFHLKYVFYVVNGGREQSNLPGKEEMFCPKVFREFTVRLEPQFCS